MTNWTARTHVRSPQNVTFVYGPTRLPSARCFSSGCRMPTPRCLRHATLKLPQKYQGIKAGIDDSIAQSAMSQYSHLSAPDPEFAALIPHLPIFPPLKDVKTLRERQQEFHVARRAHLEPHLPEASAYRVEEYKVAVDGGEITVRCLVPSTEDIGKTFPVLVWFHGGGFAVGDLGMDDYSLRIICVQRQVSVVNVDYRLAPEHIYPVPWDDCYAATKWVVENTAILSASLAKGFIVAGTSAGGNLAAAVACRARDDPFFTETPITGQILQIPTVVNPEDPGTEKFRSELLSLEQNKDAFLLNKDLLLLFLKVVKAPISDPGVSVLLQPSHAGLPAAYVQIAGGDPLRDEGLLYAKLLKDAGVKTKLDVYPGVPHGFHTVFPQLKASIKWENDLIEGIKWLLQVSGSHLA